MAQSHDGPYRADSGSSGEMFGGLESEVEIHVVDSIGPRRQIVGEFTIAQLALVAHSRLLRCRDLSGYFKTGDMLVDGHPCEGGLGCRGHVKGELGRRGSREGANGRDGCDSHYRERVGDAWRGRRSVAGGWSERREQE